MKQLNKIQTFIFILGGLMMVAGVGLYVFGIAVKAVSAVFFVGSVLFAVMQIAQRYEGKEITLKRLRSIMTIADVAFIIAGVLMLENAWHFIYAAYVGDTAENFNVNAFQTYRTYIYNKWVVALLVAAILELYSLNRISYELKKADRKTEKNIKE